MINYKLVKVYNWFDIDAEICRRVGVESLYGRWINTETGEAVGVGDGEYRNFWHNALDSFIPERMRNDTIVTLWGIEDWESSKDYYLKKHGAWTEPYFQAYFDIMQELDPNFDGIEVQFSW